MEIPSRHSSAGGQVLLFRMVFAAILVQDICRFTFFLGNDFPLHFRDFDRGIEVHGSSNI